MARRKLYPFEYDLIEDAGLLEKQPSITFPQEEPDVPHLHEEDNIREQGYSDLPAFTRVVPLSRKQYTRTEAATRFNELKNKHGWRVVGRRFSTGRFWCWRIIP